MAVNVGVAVVAVVGVAKQRCKSPHSGEGAVVLETGRADSDSSNKMNILKKQIQILCYNTKNRGIQQQQALWLIMMCLEPFLAVWINELQPFGLTSLLRCAPIKRSICHTSPSSCACSFTVRPATARPVKLLTA